MANLLYKIYSSCDSFIYKLSQPNAKYIQNDKQRRITHWRNNIFLRSKLLFMFLFFLDMIIKQNVSINVIRILFTLSLFFCDTFSGRYPPIVTNFVKTVICLAYQAFVLDSDEIGIYRAWCSVFIFPIYFYVYTGSLWYFLAQIAIQATFLNTWSKKMIINFMFMGTEESYRTIIYCTNIVLANTALLISFLHHIMQYAHKKILIAEKQKEEIENQKNFLLGFSHELRNLINSVTGNVKLAALEILSPKVKELLQNAELYGELLLHLINNILDTGKAQVGELEIHPVSTRTYETLERIWRICAELIKRKNLTGQMKIPKNLPKCMLIDHYRLTQIFLNLVGNAVKFTDNGSVDISVEWLSQNESVDESCFQPYPFNYYDEHDEGLFEKHKTLSSVDKNLLRLDLSSQKISSSILKESTICKKGVLKIIVNDTGCGMSKDDTKKLFQRSNQVCSDKSDRRIGTGLGLFITKEICHRLQGDIKFFSAKGCGSSIICCIPAEVAEEGNHIFTQDNKSLKSSIESWKLEAMIVDDIPFNTSILTNFFKKLDVKVTETATNGLEAYNKYVHLTRDRKRPHIVTMDIDMPVMDGKESTRRIRTFEEQMKLEPCFLIIISGNCCKSEIAECVSKQGSIRANHFLKKPVAIEEFSQVLNNYFANKQLQENKFTT